MRQSPETAPKKRDIRRQSPWAEFLRKLRKNKTAMVGFSLIFIFVFMAIFAPFLAPHDPLEPNVAMRLAPPGSEDRLLGADELGRDMLSRLIFGARISLLVGLSATALGAAVGVFTGLLAGYYGKWLDSLLMRICDILLTFPGILLALVIVAIRGPSTANVIIAIAFFAIPTFARVTRGSVLGVKNLEYIDAIKAMGASDARVLARHVFPNVLSPIIVQASVYIATAIMIGAALSFLGVGTPPPDPEWGSMLAAGRGEIRRAIHLSLFPGLMIFLLVVGINLFGEGVRDALEPKNERR